MKRLGLLTWLLLTVGYALAAEVTEQDARREAETFLRQRGRMPQAAPMRLAAKARRNRAAATDEACSYYIFNVGSNNGFVVVSGDDRTDAILGYADSGMIDLDRMPDALKAWLEGYADQMAWLDEHQPQRVASRRSIARSPIAPLIQTRWDQGAPYNLNTPVKSEEHTATGCVATSMAQLMYYYRWPKLETEAVPGYTTRTNKFALDALPSTTFDWKNMQLTYASSTDLDIPANAAVAQLMQYCGWALQMNYDVQSSAYNVCIPVALKKYFGYADTDDWLQRKDYSYEEWIELIYEELAAHRPVIYGGQSAGGGHSFVCDGYDLDDYFHINWGWGGSSDGYFRLTLLSPYEQGIGGSSTNDGFSYGQEILTGIKPRANGTSAGQRLSLEGFQYESGSSSTVRVIERASAEDAFTSIPLYAILCNYAYGTPTWDVQVRLVNEEGVVQHTLFEHDDWNFTFNTNNYINVNDCSIPASVADGTYHLEVVCRQDGEVEWQKCYGTNTFGMEAVVSGNTLTLTATRVSGAGTVPTCTGIDLVTETPAKGHEVELIAHIHGKGVPYFNRMLLMVSDKVVMGCHADIPADADVDVRFNYTPSTAGENVLKIVAGSTTLCTKTITVAESDATNNLELSFTPTITNLSGEQLYGNAVRLTLEVANASKENSYVGQVNCSLRKYASKGADVAAYEPMGVLRKNVVVGKESSTDVSFNYDGLELGAFYRLRITYSKNGVTTDGVLTDCYEMTEGYFAYNDDGTTTISPVSSTISAASAVCLDLRAVSALAEKTITPSTNPNCLYLLRADAEVPDALAGKNVVKGETAEAINIGDGSDFYSPIDFTAKAISYNRTFDLAAAGSSGWTTIVLPFDVATVKVGEKTVDWFHSASDTGKNFWVKTFTGDDTGTVYFDFVSTMQANTPYIIAVPGDTWGEEWQMTGKVVTFSATNQPIAATRVVALSGNDYKLCGATNHQPLSEVYMLNAKGSKFVKTATVTSDAFRAWFAGSSIHALTLPSLSIASGMPTALDAPQLPSILVEQSFDLLGRPSGDKNRGIYINKGKKYLKK